MKLKYILMAATFAALFLAALISQQFKKRKGQSGTDQKRIQRIAAEQLADSASYTIVYAHCSQTKLAIGRPAVTTYSSYIVAFRPGELFVIPLQFSGQQIISHPGFRLNQENVGAIQVDKASRITFFGTDGTMLCTLDVTASHTADGPFQPLNIQQKAEAAKFQTFLQQFTTEIRDIPSRTGSPVRPHAMPCPQQETDWHRNI